MFSVTETRMQHKYRLKLADNELVLIKAVKHVTEITYCRLSPSDAQYLNCQPVRFNSQPTKECFMFYESDVKERWMKLSVRRFQLDSTSRFQLQSVVFFHPGATRPKQWYENLLPVS